MTVGAMTRTSAMLLLVAAMATTGANVPVAKALAAEIPAGQLLVLRFALASLILMPLARLEAGPRLGTLSARQWGLVAILAAVGSVLFTSFILAGVTRTSAASAGIILAVLPAAVAAIGFGMGERPRRGDILMIGLAVVGVVLVQVKPSGSGDLGASDAIIGNLMILLAVICEATFVVAARRISAELPPLRLSLAVALVSLGLCLVAVLPVIGSLSSLRISGPTWGLLIWYTLTASVICTALWYVGVPHVETWAAGLATAAVPVAALVVSVLWLGETLSMAQATGAALVVAAIAAGTLSQRETTTLTKDDDKAKRR